MDTGRNLGNPVIWTDGKYDKEIPFTFASSFRIPLSLQHWISFCKDASLGFAGLSHTWALPREFAGRIRAPSHEPPCSHLILLVVAGLLRNSSVNVYLNICRVFFREISSLVFVTLLWHVQSRRKLCSGQNETNCFPAAEKVPNKGLLPFLIHFLSSSQLLPSCPLLATRKSKLFL